MPLAIPCTICLPIVATLLGTEDSSEIILLIMLVIPDATCPAAPRIPDASPEMPLLPNASSLDGNDISAFTIASMIFVPADATAPLSARIPFLIAATACLPRLIQLNAENTATIACIIDGIAATRLGIAAIRPCANVNKTCPAVTSSLGALSFIIPAMFVTICGM